MDKKKLISLLTHSERLNKNDSEIIEELIRQYPYCQTAHILLAKERSLNKEEFEDYLNIAAVYACDRERLYELIHGNEYGTLEKAVQKKQIKKKSKPKAKRKGVESTAKTDEVYSFSEWLTLLHKGKVSIDAKPETQKKQLVKKTNPIKTAKKKDKKDKIQFKIAHPRQSELKLIESFVRRSKKTRTKKTVPIEDIAQQSIIEDGNLISETLAQIYVQQDNYDKAIRIYEKLSLLYPKKKTYFARQIKKLFKK